MRSPGRRRIVSVVLIALGMLSGACAAPSEGAMADSEPLVRLLPGETHLAAGRRLLAAHEPALAMDAFDTSITAEGASFDAFTGGGIAAYRQGLLTLARRYFEEASRLAPESVVGQANLGVVLFELKEYYPARNAFRTAVALSSGENELALNDLNRVEAVIAEIEQGPAPNAALSREVVRLGSSEFRLKDSTSQQTDADAQ
jgi:Tfp pilus assembly protein PilF